MKQPTDIGVIIARFQVHELHEAHRALIDSVQEKHHKVIIFIGLAPVRGTTINPLDFNSRKRMIQETYPDIDVYYIEDNKSDEIWSKNLDREISKLIKPRQTVTLYGSRDSFIPHYGGNYPTVELESSSYISGTEIRKRISINWPTSPAFRAGVIASTFDRFPTCYPTVDIIVYDQSKQMVLLGKKPHEKKLRFIGGFADPTSESYEIDAIRELHEEAGLIEVQVPPQYIGSMIIDDWRYRRETDKIKTLVFVTEYMYGRPEAGDDIESVHWIPLKELINNTVNVLEKEHIPIARLFVEKYVLKYDIVVN